MHDPRLVAPSIFWFWNANLTSESIERRLDAFLDRGIRSVYIHPMPDDFRPDDFHGGMTTEYLSPAYFDLVVMACEQLRQRGMTLWLYDEGGWPSGRAGGRIVREDRDFAARGLQKLNGHAEEIDFLAQCDFPDLMNINATNRFIELTHEGYRQAVGHEFGRTIRGIFTDEPRILGRLGSDTIPWSPTLPAAFERQHGYPLAEALPLLFEADRMNERTWRARRDYLSTISNEICRCYFDPIHTWCESNGLLFEGHHTGDNDFARHGEYFGHYLEQAERYHIPGVDAIWRQIFPGQSGGNYVSLAASSAWLAGRRVAVSELFGVYGQGLTLWQMKWISAHHFVRGVNRQGLMASLESNHGSRSLGVCSDFSPHDLRWRDLDVYIKFLTRAGEFTLRGTPVVQAAMFYRIEQLYGDEAEAFAKRHERVADAVLDKLYPLLFIGEKNIERAHEMGVTDLVVHAAAPLDPSECEALENAAEMGIQVHHVTHAGQVKLPTSTVIQPLTTFEGIRALPLRDDDGRMHLMLFNESNREQEIRFCWLGQPLQEYPLDDDSTLNLRPLREHEGVCHVKLMPGELRAWEAADRWIKPDRWSVLQAVPLADGWTVQTTERLSITDRPTLEAVTSPKRDVKLGDHDTEEMFSGTRVYRCTINTEVNPAYRYVLDLGTVFDACEVCMDDQVIGRRAWSPWRVDLTNALQRGARELSVRVTNTAAGVWLESTANLPDETTWPSIYLNIAAPFMRESCRAGLAGPVWLLAMAQNK